MEVTNRKKQNPVSIRLQDTERQKEYEELELYWEWDSALYILRTRCISCAVYLISKFRKLSNNNNGHTVLIHAIHAVSKNTDRIKLSVCQMSKILEGNWRMFRYGYY